MTGSSVTPGSGNNVKKAIFKCQMHLALPIGNTLKNKQMFQIERKVLTILTGGRLTSWLFRQCPWPEFQPKLLDMESSALTMRQPRLLSNRVEKSRKQQQLKLLLIS